VSFPSRTGYAEEEAAIMGEVKGNKTSNTGTNIKTNIDANTEQGAQKDRQLQLDPEKHELTIVRQSLEGLNRRLQKLATSIDRSNIKDYVELNQKPWHLIWRSLYSGVARGAGIALGFSVFAATIVYFLQLLGALNLPIIGDYIADLVRIVKHQLESGY
jgi:maltodextrin utilization protein YvdJ